MTIIAVIIALVCCILLGKASKSIALKKGYSERLFFWLGFFFWPVPIIMLFVKDKRALDAKQDLTNADVLLKYKSLLDSGAITQQEFDSKKGELLNMLPVENLSVEG